LPFTDIFAAFLQKSGALFRHAFFLRGDDRNSVRPRSCASNRLRRKSFRSPKPRDISAPRRQERLAAFGDGENILQDRFWIIVGNVAA
jgi:hypothetical protein